MNFVSIDFETSEYSSESACAVGLVKYCNGEIVDSFYSLIKPPKLYIRPDFTKIHGLSLSDVKDAPLFAEIWDLNIKPFIGSLPLAAHNAAFDMGVLSAVLQWYKLTITRQSYFCTCILARRSWLGLKSYSLSSLAGKFGIVYNAHHALDDAKTCGKLVLMSAKKYGAKDINELLSASGVKMKVLK